MNVTVFGGSTPSEADYQQAERLGSLLAQAGHSVLTGGYIGTMEAVSKGAAKGGAQVIGVTCEQIEAWRPVRANRWVGEERRFSTLRERIFGLIEGCDSAIALPGGPGTLTEISLTWNLLLTEAISPRPLILVGSGWRDIFNHLFQEFDPYIPVSQRAWLVFAGNVDDAVARLASSN